MYVPVYVCPCACLFCFFVCLFCLFLALFCLFVCLLIVPLRVYTCSKEFQSLNKHYSPNNFLVKSCPWNMSLNVPTTTSPQVSDLGHILNLDGVGFGFQGIGEYHLLQLRPNIVLEGKFIMCQQNFSCLSFVGMRVGSNGHGYAEITVQAPYLTTSEPPVYVNGALNTVRKVAYFTYFEIRRMSLHEVILDVYNTVQVGLSNWDDL